MIGRLLALPVTGPARAGWSVLRQIVQAAEDELYDESRIVGEIRALSAELDAGRISPADHAAAEEALLEQLIDARAYNAAREERP